MPDSDTETALIERLARKDVLLKAAMDVLDAMRSSKHVLSYTEIEVRYDGAICDLPCLRDDIRIELDSNYASGPSQT